VVLRELLARFGVDFDDGDLKKGSQAIEGVIDKLKGLATVAGAIAFGRQVVAMVNQVRTMGDELDKTSIQLGISTEDLQKWRFAAGLAGVDGAAFAQSLGLLQKNAFEASRGSAQMADSFRRLGVEVRNTDGSLKDGDTLLEEVGVGLNNLEDDSEKVALSLTLMGRSGRRLLPLFKDGAEGIRIAREEFAELGGGLSQDVIDKSVQLTDDMARLDTALLGVKSTIALSVLPTIIRFVQGLIEIGRKTNELIRGTNIFKSAFLVLTSAVVAAALKMTIALAPLILKFALVAAGIAVVILVVDDLITLFDGGQSVIGEFIDSMFGVGTTVEIVERLKEAWEGLTLAVSDAINAVKNFSLFEGPPDVAEQSRQIRRERGNIRERQARDAAAQGTVVRFPGESVEQAQQRFDQFQQEQQQERQEQQRTARIGRRPRGQATAQQPAAAAPVIRRVRENNAATTNVDARTEANVVVNAQSADAQEVVRLVGNEIRKAGAEERRNALASLLQRTSE
jgi:hypothetical protein